MEEIRTQLASHRIFEDLPDKSIDRFLPRSPAKAMWIRHLLERLNHDYHSLIQLHLLEPTEIENVYEKLRHFAQSIQQRLYQQWWTEASELQPKRLLQKAFLKVNQSLLEVYFDPHILIALNESLWWIRLKYEIPYSLTDVYSTRRSFRQMREETNEFVRKFNRAVESLRGEEMCLFEERIRMIFKKLQPALTGKVNCNDEKIFQEFALEINRNIDQVGSIFPKIFFRERILFIVVNRGGSLIQRELYPMLYKMSENQSTIVHRNQFRDDLSLFIIY